MTKPLNDGSDDLPVTYFYDPIHPSREQAEKFDRDWDRAKLGWLAVLAMRWLVDG